MLKECPWCTSKLTKETVTYRHYYSNEDVGPRPDLNDREAEEAWDLANPIPHCQKGHPLSRRVLTADTIIMTIIGPPYAGKSVLVQQIAKLGDSSELLARGVSVSVSLDVADKFDPIYRATVLPSTQVASKDNRRHAWVFNLTIRPPSKMLPSQEVDLLVFDLGGEDRVPGEASTGNGQVIEDLRSRAPFLPKSDVVVFAVPPDGLPNAANDPALSRGDQQYITALWVQEVMEWLRGKRKCTTAVVTLTKADRYKANDTLELPESLLSPRKLRGDLPAYLGDTMASEQRDLIRFFDKAGGMKLLEHAEKINGTVFLTAVSGAAGDDLEDGKRAAVLKGMGANRALDPLLIALMRAGWGRFERSGRRRGR